LFDVDVVRKTLQGKNFSNDHSPLDFTQLYKLFFPPLKICIIPYLCRRLSDRATSIHPVTAIIK